MKCVCIQYIAAISKLKKEEGFIPTRTIHLTFVPDEEIGGEDGMGRLMESAWFKSFRISLALDEGLASEDDSYSVFYGERLPWWIRVQAEGGTGHGSRFIEGTAVEQVVGVATRALAFRAQQREALHGSTTLAKHAGCSHAVAGRNRKSARTNNTLGDVTTLNITKLQAGITSGGKDVLNVVPPSAELCMDIRISPVRDIRQCSCQSVNL
jgi:aminoacylase